MTWATVHEELVRLLETVELAGEEIIVYAEPVGNTDGNPQIIVYPPSRTVFRGSGMRRTVYTVTVRAAVRDRDLDSATAILDALTALLEELVDRNVTLGGRAHIQAQTFEAPGTIPIPPPDGAQFLAADCILTIEAYEPATFGPGQ